jgi:threonine dehydratase
MSADEAAGSPDTPTGIHRRTPDTASAPHELAPTAEQIDDAYRAFRQSETPTPLVESVALSQRYGRSVYLKLESLSPIRSFKHRGALAAVRALAARHSRVVTASTGNHGQGVAYAATRIGIHSTVLVPANALPDKVEAIRSLGADVRVAGANLTEAQQAAEELAQQEPAAYLEDGEDPLLMAGAAGVMLEILDQLPSVGTVIVPVGGGNLIAGSLLAAEGTNSVTVAGVQSTAAPAVYASWRTGRYVQRPCETFAGGLATERPGVLSLDVILRHLTTMGLVTENDLFAAIALAFRHTGVLLEGAAAAPLALLEQHGHEIDGDPVVLVASGSWISSDQLTEALGREATRR